MMIIELFDKLNAVIADSMVDVEKFDVGKNNAAGVRVRKSMQDVKAIAQEIRKTVSDIKLTRKEG